MGGETNDETVSKTEQERRLYHLLILTYPFLLLILIRCSSIGNFISVSLAGKF